jgi:SAM-dependent methyltransferase
MSQVTEQPLVETCILCGGEHAEIVSTRDRRRRPLTSMLCTDCGLICNSPIPTDAEVEAFYRDAYRLEYKGAAVPSRRQIVRNFKRVLSFFQRNAQLFANARTCLDVGAGSGEFMYFAKSLGMEAKGIEPNKGYAAYARESLDLDVDTASIQDTDYPERGADLIRLNHVLEHLNRPVESLKALSRWLANDGLIYIEVPNIERYARGKSRGNIFHFGHVFNFSPWTLRACAGLAGLEEVESVRVARAGSTGTFFRKGRTWTAEEARNPENAASVAEMLRRHYAERRFAGKARKLMRKFRRQLCATGTGLRLSEPAAIGAHFVDRFKQSTSGQGGLGAAKAVVTANGNGERYL